MALALALSSCTTEPPRASTLGEPSAVSTRQADGGDLRARALRQNAKAFGISDPPQVDLVRESSPFDYDQAQVDCLRAAGYDASIDPTGGIQGKANVDNPTDEYWQQFNLASYVCQAQYPLAEIYYEPLSEGQEKVYADYFLDELPKCLEEFDVQFEAPPTREVFLAQFATEGAWTPYTTAQIPPGKTASVMTACPQFIPPGRLWAKPK